MTRITNKALRQIARSWPAGSKPHTMACELLALRKVQLASEAMRAAGDECSDIDVYKRLVRALDAYAKVGERKGEVE